MKNSSKMLRVLDLGSGLKVRVPGACRLDRSLDGKPTVVADLDRHSLPFLDRSFDRILCIQILEHFSDIPRIMDELHRLCRPGGTLEIVTPHFSHRNAFTDPTHKHQFGARSFDFFLTAEKPLRFMTISTSARFELVSRSLSFGPAWINVGRLLYRLFGLDTYETYLSGIFPASDIKIVLKAL
ncbi:methyltransferase domain-containing protein [candidate division KSB1 bacterium]